MARKEYEKRSREREKDGKRERKRGRKGNVERVDQLVLALLKAVPEERICDRGPLMFGSV